MWKNFVWGDGTREVKKVEINGKIAFQRSGERLVPFSSNPAPTSWTQVGSKNYTSSNIYGTWKISASELYIISSGSVDNSFDNDTSTNCRYTNGSTLEIDLPQNVYVNPTNIYIYSGKCKNTSKVQGYNIDTNTWEDLSTFGGSSGTKIDNISVSNNNYYSKIRLDMVRYSSTSKYCEIYELQITSGTLKIIT